MDSETRYSHLSNHFDLISETDHKILKLPLTWFWRHVKGHSDDQAGPLEKYATLNLECDTEAK